jgi:PAS domain S-box-containing protein
LRESEERFRSAFDDAPIGVALVALDGRWLRVNQTLCDIVGYSEGELLSTNVQSTSFPGDLDDLELVRMMLDGTIQHYHIETRCLHKRGDIVHIMQSCSLVRDGAGEPLYFIRQIQDITARKHAEAALRERETQLRTLGDNLPNGMMYQVIREADGTHRFAYVSAGAERLNQLSPDACLRDPSLLYGQVLEEYRPLVGEAEELSLQSMSVFRIEVPMVRPDGSMIWVLLCSIPRRLEDGRVIWDGIEIDVTELRRVEEELRRAKDAAEEAARVKADFLATMSHEIRTPMNAVIGFTGLVLDTALTPEQRDYLETVRMSGETLLTIINDILDFSKIESGRLELEQHPFDVRDCIEEALDLVAPAATSKQLDLVYRLDEHVPATIVGDVTRLRQLLVNLLSNAVRFTERGDVLVTATGRSRGDALHEVHFAVRDTGIGIPRDRLDRLFQAFSQVDASVTRRYGGTGLGLAICKRLSELMGGQIWVESELGRGSTFHFTIQAIAAPNEPRVHSRGAITQLEGKRLLIVDDNALNRQILAEEARSWGMVATAEAGAAKALERIGRGESFDVIVTDLCMPDVDGIGFVEELRAAHVSTPAVLLSSLSAREGLGDAVPRLGLAAVLNKPLKRAQLRHALVEALTVGPAGGGRAMPEARSGDLEPTEQRPLRILVAEDNAVNQKIALRMLERHGYRADVVANGHEVLAALESIPYDLIFMDIQMPELDGLETSRRIHATLPEDQRPRIVAMTASAMQGDRERCIAAGMDDYITKPVRPEDLRRALTRASLAVEVHERRTHTPKRLGLVDLDRLADLCGGLGAASAIAELVELYLVDAERRVSSLERALDEGNDDEVRRDAHGLRGSSATIGAWRVMELAAMLEERDASTPVEATRDLGRELRACFDATRDELSSIV